MPSTLSASVPEAVKSYSSFFGIGFSEPDRAPLPPTSVAPMVLVQYSRMAQPTPEAKEPLDGQVVGLVDREDLGDSPVRGVRTARGRQWRGAGVGDQFDLVDVLGLRLPRPAVRHQQPGRALRRQPGCGAVLDERGN